MVEAGGNADGRVAVRLTGRLAMRDATGQDLTPRGARARALIALLCLSPGMKRPRRWIEALLWSDRSPDLASGSLRQVLAELRRCLGPQVGVLHADRETVGLDPGAVAVDLLRDPAGCQAAMAVGSVLLEGLDIASEGFEDWLRTERARFAVPDEPVPDPAAPALGAPRLVLLLSPGPTEPRLDGLIARSFAELVGRMVSDFIGVELIGPEGGQLRLGPQDRGLRLVADMVGGGDGMHLIARIEATGLGRLVWLRQARLSGQGFEALSDPRFQEAAWEAAEAVLAAIPALVGTDRSVLRAEALAARALREMLSFETSRYQVADGLLRSAAALAPSPRFDAWAALLKMLMTVELAPPDAPALREEAEVLASRALAAGFSNSIVLAVLAMVRIYLHRDIAGGAGLARDALSLNSGTAFAHIGLGTALLRLGRAEEAWTVVGRGREIARNSPFRHFWDLSHCLTEVATGRFDDAILSGEAAALRAPGFRAPLRQLYALYTWRGDAEKARRVGDRLRLLEPDFSLAMIRETPEYPADMLRKSGLAALRDIAWA